MCSCCLFLFSLCFKSCKMIYSQYSVGAIHLITFPLFFISSCISILLSGIICLGPKEYPLFWLVQFANDEFPQFLSESSLFYFHFWKIFFWVFNSGLAFTFFSVHWKYFLVFGLPFISLLYSYFFENTVFLPLAIVF